MNKTMLIDLSACSRVKEFVQETTNHKHPIYLSSKDGHYRVDAKSILGVFSLDLSKPVVLECDPKINIEIFNKFKAE